MTGQAGSASLLGDGPDRPAHEALAARLGLQPSVDFQGDVDDVPAQLARHGIFVLMSDHEGLPISLIEAMRARMAIVASDLPGVRELLPDPGHALLVPADPEALAAALRQLMESPALRARLGAAARQRYERHYTAERMGSAVRGVYAAALRHSRSRMA
ncbi:glycosyltransferase [Paracidovorax avenae]|nr:glycosyltransferase [Paracidovorax avenae]